MKRTRATSLASLPSIFTTQPPNCKRTLLPGFIFVVLCQVLTLHAQKLPQIMVLGTTHFNNPNHDINNMAVDDVMTPERQSQILALCNALAQFRPTRIAIELPPSEQANLDRRYADYVAGRYTLTSSERDQLDFRLAAMLHLPRLDAVDYKAGPPGPDEAYDFLTYAKAHGMLPQWDAFLATGKQYVAEESDYFHKHTLLEWFRRANTPEHRRTDNQNYFALLHFGDSTMNPGANWVGSWHTRNMIIMENVLRLAKPDDRVLVIFGEGHTFLLNQFAQESGEFTVVDAENYLSR